MSFDTPHFAFNGTTRTPFFRVPSEEFQAAIRVLQLPHRSLNKLAIALAAGKIQAGVLILPSRELYEHLTDRIGNIRELSPYLGMWSGLSSTVERGLLAITVVEHDELTDDEAHPYLKSGTDGRSKEGRQKRGATVKPKDG